MAGWLVVVVVLEVGWVGCLQKVLLQLAMQQTICLPSCCCCFLALSGEMVENVRITINQQGVSIKNVRITLRQQIVRFKK